jgi:TetR/AcrR family fatty acid metabolism transcriptional regulator
MSPKSKTPKNTDKFEQILEAALCAFAKDGFYNTKIADIADRANVADGTIYLYFENKDDILINLFERRMEWFIERSKSRIDDIDGTSVEKLEQLFFMHLQIAADHRELAEFITVELRQSAKFIKEYENQYFHEYLKFIETLIRQGQNNGELRSGIDPERAARSMFGALDEQLLQLALGGCDIEDVREETRTLKEVLINGIRTR